MMDLNQEFTKMKIGDTNIKKAIRAYQDELTIGSGDYSLILLYFLIRKYKTLDVLKVRRPERFATISEQLNKCGMSVYRDLGDIDSENRINVLESRIFEDITPLLPILDGLSQRIKSAYADSSCKYVCAAISCARLSFLKASKNVENRYYLGFYDGVFATSDVKSLERYIPRAVLNKEIQTTRDSAYYYGGNPFSKVEKDKVVLKKTVPVYFMDIDGFEPQFDFTIADGEPHFVFHGEWISPREIVKCEEHQVNYLPIDFIKRQKVYVEEKPGKMIQIQAPNLPEKSVEGDRSLDE